MICQGVVVLLELYNSTDVGIKKFAPIQEDWQHKEDLQLDIQIICSMWNLSHPFVKTNCKLKFQLNRRVWVGSQQTMTDWINKVFHKQPGKATHWIDMARVVESVCLRSLNQLNRRGFSQVCGWLFLKSRQRRVLNFFVKKYHFINLFDKVRSSQAHHISWWIGLFNPNDNVITI